MTKSYNNLRIAARKYAVYSSPLPQTPPPPQTTTTIIKR
jgi:hypothetical protein